MKESTINKQFAQLERMINKLEDTKLNDFDIGSERGCYELEAAIKAAHAFKIAFAKFINAAGI